MSAQTNNCLLQNQIKWLKYNNGQLTLALAEAEKKASDSSAKCEKLVNQFMRNTFTSDDITHKLTLETAGIWGQTSLKVSSLSIHSADGEYKLEVALAEPFSYIAATETIRVEKFSFPIRTTAAEPEVVQLENLQDVYQLSNINVITSGLSLITKLTESTPLEATYSLGKPESDITFVVNGVDADTTTLAGKFICSAQLPIVLSVEP